MADFPVYDEYRSMISVTPKPVRTTVQVGAFVDPLLIEIDAVAVRGSAVSDTGVER